MSNFRPYRRQGGISPLWVLIGVCAVIFFAEYFLDTSGSIIQRFALYPNGWSTQPWTLLTYVFLHGSWSHIIFNMISLYFLGILVIYIVGDTVFLLVFFLGGIFGGLAVILLASLFHQTTLVVGSSGAIFALGGLLMVMRPNIKVMMFFLPIQIPLWIAILINFALLVAVSPFLNISWQAHLGGLIFGAAVGYYFRQREIRHY